MTRDLVLPASYVRTATTPTEQRTSLLEQIMTKHTRRYRSTSTVSPNKYTYQDMSQL